MKPSICFISADNFEREVIGETRPVLLLCMPRDDEFSQQLQVIKEIASKYGEALKVGLLEEAFIVPFKKKYKVSGTPTFLVLLEGKEKNRSLGLADEQTLTDLISRSYPLNDSFS